MAKAKYEDLANEVVDLVGGADNITFLTHCMTRLRMNVKDHSLVEQNKISEIKGVVGNQWQDEQFQIIIGQDVADAYKLISQKTGKGNAEEDETDNVKSSTVKAKKFRIGAIFDAITGSIAPLIPMLIGGGMLKVVLLLLTMTNVLSTENSTYLVLSAVADAAFYFLPVFLGATAAKKFNANQGLGMLMGAMLLHPSFVALASGGASLNVFGLPITSANYASTILPVIMIVWIMSYVQRFFSRISPKSIRSIVEPLGTILVVAPLALSLIGPLGVLVGDYLAQGIQYIYDTTGFFAVALMSAVMPLLVMTGMHSAFVPYWTVAMAKLGYEPFFLTAFIISNLNQGIASLAVAIRAKSTALKSTATSTAITAIVGGVTEPALFGVNLKYRRPLYASMIGNFIGAMYAGIMHVYIYVFPGSGGIFGLPSFIGPTPANLIHMIIGCVIGMVSTFIIALIMGIKEEK